MQKITSCLWFDKECEEAITFYVSVFNDSPAKKTESKIVSIKRYPDVPLEGPPPGMEGKVLTAIFELEGQKFVALDGGPYFKPNGAVSMMVECETQEEVDHFWDKLGEGGDPNAKQCGWLQDKYGFSWQVIPAALNRLMSDPDKEKADRVLRAMMHMKKIDISKLQEAYDQQ